MCVCCVYASACVHADTMNWRNSMEERERARERESCVAHATMEDTLQPVPQRYRKLHLYNVIREGHPGRAHTWNGAVGRRNHRLIVWHSKHRHSAIFVVLYFNSTHKICASAKTPSPLKSCDDLAHVAPMCARHHIGLCVYAGVWVSGRVHCGQRQCPSAYSSGSSRGTRSDT